MKTCYCQWNKEHYQSLETCLSTSSTFTLVIVHTVNQCVCVYVYNAMQLYCIVYTYINTNTLIYWNSGRGQTSPYWLWTIMFLIPLTLPLCFKSVWVHVCVPHAGPTWEQAGPGPQWDGKKRVAGVCNAHMRMCLTHCVCVCASHILEEIVNSWLERETLHATPERSLAVSWQATWKTLEQTEQSPTRDQSTLPASWCKRLSISMGFLIGSEITLF
jgi:hypothetical protein